VSSPSRLAGGPVQSLKPSMRALAAARHASPLAACARPFSSLPPRARIYELGPRDGLQNEAKLVDTDTKIAFIDMLSRTGVSAIEPTSFVSPKWVPQMADHKEVLGGIEMVSNVDYPILVPNLQGFNRSVAAGATSVAIMSTPSTSFARKNLNSTPEETVSRAEAIARAASDAGVRCRAYVSTALGCPFDGHTPPEKVAEHAARLYRAGCYEVCLADTIGTGTPGSMKRLIDEVLPLVPPERLAVHCHDTYGQALANILVALQHGIAVIDSSVAGLGGCPYAGPAASGNVATEDVVYMLQGLGIETGVDFDRVVTAGQFIVDFLGRPNSSRAGVASIKRQR